MNKSSKATNIQKHALMRNKISSNFVPHIFLHIPKLSTQPIKPKTHPGIYQPRSPTIPKSKQIKSNKDMNFTKISNVIITETLLTIIFKAFFMVTLLS